MQFCDFKTFSTRVLNEFSDVASATKLGRLFQILVTLLVKVKLCRFSRISCFMWRLLYWWSY